MVGVRSLDALCERIYDATVDPALWSITLDEIAAVGGSEWAALLVMRTDSWVGWSTSPSISAALDPYLRSDAAKRSITTQRLFEFDRCGFASDEDLFSLDEYRADTYTKWANANGYHHGAATGIRINSGDLAVVQVMRRTGDRRFDSKDLEKLDQLRPHLARAAMLSARWKMERLRAATDALALVGLPAVVLTAECRVVCANSLAEQLTGHLTWLARDRLILVDSAAAAKLRQQVVVCANAASHEAASSFPAWDQEHQCAMVVHVIPLKNERRELFEGGLALVIVTTAGEAKVASAELIREIFDLTAAEARVASQLAIGRSLEEIAGIHRVSLSTVRSQAKSILHKVGAHRQAELAVRLSGLTPISPDPHTK